MHNNVLISQYRFNERCDQPDKISNVLKQWNQSVEKYFK